MKTKTLVRLLAPLMLFSGFVTAAPLGTAFTYQGQLAEGGNPVSGVYDLRFTIYDAAGDGAIVAGPITNSPTGVSNGLFTVALDFGSGIFTGEARWLEIGVRTNGGADFTTLDPRQALTVTPNAQYAVSANSASTALFAVSVAANGVSTASLQTNAVTGDKVANGSLTPADLNVTTFSNTFWKVDGNADTTPGTHFLGTTDDKALEFKANNQRVLRLEPDATSPNVAGGYSGNSVASGLHGVTISGGGQSGGPNTIYAGAHFSTIAGGRQNSIRSSIGDPSDSATIAGGSGNLVGFGANIATISGGAGNQVLDSADYSIIGGGAFNAISNSAWSSAIGGGRENAIAQFATYAFVGGGYRNRAAAAYATVGGGSYNQSAGLNATVAGGYSNSASGSRATVAGGQYNTNSGDYGFLGGGERNLVSSFHNTVGGGSNNFSGGPFATVPGGADNQAIGSYAFAAGRRAKANQNGVFVWADWTDADFTSTAANQFLIRASGGVGIGKNNPATALDVNGTVTATAFSGSGSGLTSLNANNLSSGTVAEARIDSALARDAEVFSLVTASDGAGSGLDADLLDGLNSTDLWKLGGNSGTTPGTQFLGTTDNQPLELKVNNVRAFRLEPVAGGTPNVIGGSSKNSVDALVMGAVIAGGGGATGSESNHIGGDFGTVVGGRNNRVQSGATHSTVGGGWDNEIQEGAQESIIGGGSRNTIQSRASWSAIAGGDGNTILSWVNEGTIGGGGANTVGSSGAWIGGGSGNNNYSVAAAIGGGSYNRIDSNARAATIGGGDQNAIQAPSATIGGGGYNAILTNADYATVGGGYHNTNQGQYATIPGGRENSATNYAFAAGRRAKAIHNGAFVWADSADVDFASTANNQFLIRASGGVGIGKSSPGTALDVNGTVTASAFSGNGAGLTSLPNGYALNAADGSPVNALYVNNSGNVGIGTTSPQSPLHVDQPSGEAAIRLTSGGTSLPLIMAMTATSDFRITNGSAASLTLKANGNVGIGRNPTTWKLEVEGEASKMVAGSWQANSDRRIKCDIAPVCNALETLGKVRLVSFRYTDDYRAQHPTIEDRRYLNVVAQEFAGVFPEAVKQTGDRLPDGEPILSVDTYPLTIYSAAAVQELSQSVRQKEARITELEKSVAELKALVNALAARMNGGGQ